MTNESGENNLGELEDTTNSPSENDDESSVPLRRGFIGSIANIVVRTWRAFRIDTTLYEDLKTVPQAPFEANKVILIFGSIAALISVLVNDMKIEYLLGTFLQFIVYYYTYVILAWFVGIKLRRANCTYAQIRIALAYGFFPTIFAAIPIPWGLLSFWGLVTMFPAIRKTLGISIVLTIVIIVGAEVLREFASPLIVSLLYDFMFFRALSG
jgi:hypothetical protein